MAVVAGLGPAPGALGVQFRERRFCGDRIEPTAPAFCRPPGNRLSSAFSRAPAGLAGRGEGASSGQK